MNTGGEKYGYNPVDDLQLYQRISQGDQEAFKLLYNRYAPVIYAFCFQYLRNEADTEDALQHIFLKLWEKRGDLKITQSVRDYLYATAKHYVLNQLRNKLSAQIKQQDIQRRNLTHQTSVEEDYMRNEVGRHLELAALLLSPVKQRIVTLRREGFSNKEISQQLQIPENTVKTYYAQSLKFLREYFKKFVLATMPFFLCCVSHI